MSGQNAVLPENLEADIWSRDRMYGLKLETTGCTIRSVSGDFILTNHLVVHIFLF
jgi:hypothetical protein